MVGEKGAQQHNQDGPGGETRRGAEVVRWNMAMADSERESHGVAVRLSADIAYEAWRGSSGWLVRREHSNATKMAQQVRHGVGQKWYEGTWQWRIGKGKSWCCGVAECRHRV